MASSLDIVTPEIVSCILFGAASDEASRLAPLVSPITSRIVYNGAIVHYRLLIVDDDPLNLDALTRVLRHEHDLVKAQSADQALEILRDEGRHIDLILADKNMPGRSGVELLVEAKALSQAMRIVLTAYPDASDLLE